MQQKSFVGPRGWAVLTLLGGAALATPFFRAPRIDKAQLDRESTGSLASGQAPHAVPVRANPASHASVASEGRFGDFSDFVQQIVPPANASPTALPAWAPAHSPMDELIAQGTAPPWQSDMASVSTMQALEPWVNQSRSELKQLSSATSLAHTWPDASSLPVGESASTLSRIPGSLAGTAQQARPAPTPRLRPPANQSLAQPKFVYQPGFQGSTNP